MRCSWKLLLDAARCRRVHASSIQAQVEFSNQRAAWEQRVHRVRPAPPAVAPQPPRAVRHSVIPLANQDRELHEDVRTWREAAEAALRVARRYIPPSTQPPISMHARSTHSHGRRSHTHAQTHQSRAHWDCRHARTHAYARIHRSASPRSMSPPTQHDPRSPITPVRDPRIAQHSGRSTHQHACRGSHLRMAASQPPDSR